MEITVAMIERVLEVTGTDYFTAKQAIIDHDGNVEEAIKAIREQADAAAADIPIDETDKEGQPAEQPAGESADQAASEETAKEETEEPDPIEELFSDEYADRLVDRIKERVKAGNVDKIRISREGRTILEVPVNVGILGGLFGLAAIPWAMILGAVTAYGLNCKIEIISSDGKSEEL